MSPVCACPHSQPTPGLNRAPACPRSIRGPGHLATRATQGREHRGSVWFVIQYNTCYISSIMPSPEKTISFRADAEKIEALDELAAAQDRSRSYLINQAIANYLELHAYQDALVRTGVEEMSKGRMVSHEEVVKRLKKRTRRAS